ncbi:RNA polymerase sigma factor [Actinoallomurus rhizosphaericola]|uniref:RNA polymerase sigma factor n=1 Tax=Actinoallomurus rhizosphaericola TaxID=2952536 RepID=UPI0020908EDF|nr:RNA polymerase sigma factor [Actinoallomurus rhizosphaericola]MCO5992548.1 RNA polymerase sigma factor [Actinoallomurus rhizosphaericola]
MKQQTVALDRDDPEWFTVLYDRYAEDVHRYIAGRLGREHADDLTADVFLVAFRKRSSFDPARGSLKPWLFGIATKIVYRHRRSEGRRLKALARMNAEQATDGHEDRVTARVAAQRAGPRLVNAIRELSPADRDVLFLTALGGLGYQEVAEALGIPTGTVGSRLNRARRELRRVLGDVNPAKEN